MTTYPRWPDDLAWPFAARQNALPAPPVGMFDPPFAAVQLNLAWASHLIGALEPLTLEQAWSGSESEVSAAVLQMQKLFVVLSQEGQVMTHPVGAVMDFAGSEAPAGWLLCDGAAVGRDTYAALYAVIGDTYGAGDGATTFNLPDRRGRVSIGAGSGAGLTARALGAQIGEESHVLTVAEMPAHRHALRAWANSNANTIASPAGRILAYFTGTGGLYLSATPNTSLAAASLDETGSGAAHNNMPPGLVLNSIIYAGV